MDPALQQALSAITGAVVILLLAVANYIQSRSNRDDPHGPRRRRHDRDDDYDEEYDDE